MERGVALEISIETVKTRLFRVERKLIEKIEDLEASMLKLDYLGLKVSLSRGFIRWVFMS